MAGRKLKIAAKLNGSTILEVVVAMVIIVIVFGIAMMIFNNVVRMSLSAKKIRAQAILKETLQAAEQRSAVSGQSVTVGEFRIEEDVRPYNNEAYLSDIHLTAYDANAEKITELEKVIIKQ
ncbi:MAG: hypothetical protein JWP94_469 [Mucilaginibacter sp.]|nr:hypothetical protein [Mucilaginibacter sp.]